MPHWWASVNKTKESGRLEISPVLQWKYSVSFDKKLQFQQKAIPRQRDQ